MKREYNWRSLTIAGLFGLLGLLILAQIIRVQNSQEAQLFLELADRYEGEYRTLYPARGSIYDRRGNLLAGNQTVYEIGVDLKTMANPHTIALAASVNLGVDYNEVFQALVNPDPRLQYVVIADYVNADRAAALQQLQFALRDQLWDPANGVEPSLAGVHFKPHLQRSYPESDLAANLLGFVSRDGRGYFGIEEKYNDLLAGNPVQVWVPEDPNRVEETPHVPNGTSLVLTIDRSLQASVEQILNQALDETDARNGVIVVMNPRDGEILAMAATPRMDPNDVFAYARTFNDATEFNRAISMPYEPGSVLKILTMAAALDSGKITPDWNYYDNGLFEYAGWSIRNWDRGVWGWQDATGCLQHSLNVCLARIAVETGAPTFYSYMNSFGLGRPTGIDLSGETGGRLKFPNDDDWSEVELATNSYGQGLTVTPIQMLMAASAIANDGKMVQPHVLSALLRDGQRYNVTPTVAGTPIRPETARVLSQMLTVSLENEASLALLPGYRIAGKTGTASIPTDSGYYATDETNASFIGWGPSDDPQFMIYVWLEAPRSSIWGSQVAAPVFAQVAEKVVILFNIPPDAVRIANR